MSKIVPAEGIILLDRAESLHKLGGISKSAFYKGIAAGRYPKPIFISPNSARWVASELDVCVLQAMEARDTKLLSDVAAVISDVDVAAQLKGRKLTPSPLEGEELVSALEALPPRTYRR